MSKSGAFITPIPPEDNGILTINGVAPNSSGNFFLTSSDGSITINPITNGEDITVSGLSTQQQLVYVDAQTGSDTTGNGSPIKPFATITHALGTITGNAITKPYAIFFVGASTENVAIKPFVSLIGTGIETSVVNGNLTSDASWNGVDDAGTTVKDIAFTSMAINMAAIANAGTFFFVGCQFASASTFTGSGNSQTLNLNRCFYQGTTTLNDVVYQGFSNTFFDLVTFTTTNAPGSIGQASGNDLYFNAISVTNPAGHIFVLNLYGCFVDGAISLNASVVSYDAISYPHLGFTFAAGAIATPRLCAPSVIPHTSVTGATYTVLSSDYYLACNRAGAIALTFPLASGSGQTFIIKDVSGAADVNNITGTSSGATFDGVATLTINSKFGSVTVTDTANNIWSIT